ncbi:hypothetical protein F5Y01DRAFT_306143 [Xylaria sp. FL0043]|nr:hypothetical protein F5Y01DRAFT_306143 [Xylaria sp. FL0043]
MVTCGGCYRRGPNLVFPSPYISPFCLHEPHLCLDCVQRDIELTIDEELTKFISCPECGAQIDDNDVFRLTTSELYDRYRISKYLSEEIECIICVENIPRRGFPRSPISPVCSHEAQCCLGCLATHLTSQLESSSPKSLTCPECRGALPYTSIQQYATPETFTRYDNLLARNGLSDEPNFCWCTSGCGSGQVHPEGRENPLMICTNCRGKTCFTHQSPWHDGLTCREYDNLDTTTTTANDGGKVESSETRSFRNRISNLLGRGKRTIIVGGVARLENDQEYRDRLLAEKLAKEEEDLERKRQTAIEEAERRNSLRRQEAQAQRETQERRAQDEEARKWKQAQKNRAQEEKARKQRQNEEDRRRRRAEEAASERALLTVSKLCPKNCGARIQKTEGCDHMKCRQCGHEFCWLCFANWGPIRKNGNGYHRSNCKYHSSKL